MDLKAFIKIGNRNLRDREKFIKLCHNLISKKYRPGIIKCILYYIDKKLDEEIRRIYRVNSMDSIAWIIKGLIRYAFLNYNRSYRYFLGSSSKQFTFSSRIKIILYGYGREIEEMCKNCSLKLFCEEDKEEINPNNIYLLLMVEDIKLNKSFLTDELDKALSNVRIDGINVFKRIWVRKIDFTLLKP